LGAAFFGAPSSAAVLRGFFTGVAAAFFACFFALGALSSAFTRRL
jgi:preprotein translocase subunit SecG